MIRNRAKSASYRPGKFTAGDATAAANQPAERASVVYPDALKQLPFAPQVC
jgi:hypothetical protein